MRNKKEKGINKADIQSINLKLMGLKLELDRLMKLHGLVDYSISSFRIQSHHNKEIRMIRCCNFGENPEFQVNEQGDCTLSCQIC